MEEATPLVELARRLCATAQAIQQALLHGDVAALPGLVEQERDLVDQLSRQLARHDRASQQQTAPAPSAALPEEVRGLVRQWWRLHRQNRILLVHAHRTVADLLERLSGAARQPAGLYGPQASVEPVLAARVNRTA